MWRPGSPDARRRLSACRTSVVLPDWRGPVTATIRGGSSSVRRRTRSSTRGRWKLFMSFMVTSCAYLLKISYVSGTKRRTLAG